MLIKSTRTSQPTGAVGIDWSNPITRGLIVAISGNNRFGIDARVIPNTQPVSAAARGLAHKAVGGSGGVVSLLNPVTSQDWTLLSFVKIPYIASYACTWGVASEFFTSRLHQATATWPNYKTGFDARPYKADWESATVFPLTPAVSAVTISSTNNAYKQYLDGAVIGSGSLSSTGSITVSKVELFAKNWGDLADAHTQLLICMAFTRTLSDAEIASISANPWQIFTPVTRTVPVAGVSVTLPTLVRPASDTSAGAWTASTGGTLASCIDEATYSDADYISVNSASTCEMVLAESAYPGGASQTLTYRASSTSGSTLTVTLKQGATTIMTRSHALTSTVTEYVDTLTAGEIAAIVAGPISVTLTSS